jgi:hypothetical protein
VRQRVIGVLPALVEPTPRPVFEVAVAFAVAETLAPIERRLRGWPELVDEVLVGSPLESQRQQAQEERGGVDGTEEDARLEPTVHRLTGSDLVEDLARLLLVEGVGAAALAGSQEAQGATRDLRIHRQREK